MYLACRLRCFRALLYRPCPALIGTAGEEGYKPQQSIRALYHAVKTRLLHAHLLKEHFSLLRLKGGYLLFELCADRQHLCALCLGNGAKLLVVVVVLVIGYAVFVHICGVDDGLDGQQVARCDKLHVVRLALVAANALALVKVLQKALENLGLVQEFLVALGVFVCLFDAALDHLHVGHDKLKVNDLNITLGVCAALDMDDILIVEAAHDMDDSVGVAYIRQELVAQSLALGCTLDKACDVDKLDDGRGVLLRLVN